MLVKVAALKGNRGSADYNMKSLSICQRFIKNCFDSFVVFKVCDKEPEPDSYPYPIF